MNAETNTQSSNTPLVSVVMPTYRAASFVARALTSIRTQTLTDWELIIIDDRSPDNTFDVIQHLTAGDARVRVEQIPVNGGPGVARNRGFDLARGKWVAILDADDAYAPDRLATLVAAGEAGRLDMVADPVIYYDVNAGRIARTWRHPGGRSEWTLKGLFDAHRQWADTYGILKPLFRRDFLNGHGIRYRPGYRYGEDVILYADALLAGAKAVVIPTGHYLYTMPIGSISGTVSGQSQTQGSDRKCIDVLRAFEKNEGQSLAIPELAALRRCYQARVRYSHLKVFKDSIRRRRMFTAMGQVVRRPLMIADMAAIARKKLARR
jgi:succinoglycan biosynthesis protein ExoO